MLFVCSLSQVGCFSRQGCSPPDASLVHAGDANLLLALRDWPLYFSICRMFATGRSCNCGISGGLTMPSHLALERFRRTALMWPYSRNGTTPHHDLHTPGSKNLHISTSTCVTCDVGTSASSLAMDTGAGIARRALQQSSSLKSPSSRMPSYHQVLYLCHTLALLHEQHI